MRLLLLSINLDSLRFASSVNRISIGAARLISFDFWLISGWKFGSYTSAARLTDGLCSSCCFFFYKIFLLFSLISGLKNPYSSSCIIISASFSKRIYSNSIWLEMNYCTRSFAFSILFAFLSRCIFISSASCNSRIYNCSCARAFASFLLIISAR